MHGELGAPGTDQKPTFPNTLRAQHSTCRQDAVIYNTWVLSPRHDKGPREALSGDSLPPEEVTRPRKEGAHVVWQHAHVRTYTSCPGHTLIPGSPHSAEQNHWDITKPVVTQGQRTGRKGQVDMG